jgi:hypothetical protein
MDADDAGMVIICSIVGLLVVLGIASFIFSVSGGYNRGYLAGEDYILNTIGAKMIGNTAKFDCIVLKDGTTVTLPRKLEQ